MSTVKNPEHTTPVASSIISTPGLYLEVILPNGQAVPMGQRGGPYVQIIRNIRQWCPYLYLEIDDVSGALRRDEAKLNDGSPMAITLGTPGIKEKTYWKCYGTPTRTVSTMNPEAFTYTVKALPRGVSDSLIQKPIKSWTGNSTDVLSDICTQLHLDFKTNVKATDSMTWLSNHKTWKDYMEDIAEHTYYGDDAVIMDCIETTISGTTDGTYMLMNIPDLFKKPAIGYIYNGRNFAHKFSALGKMNSMSAAKATHHSRSGMHGFRSLYGLDTQEIQPDGSVSYHTKVTPKDASRIADVSQTSHAVGNASPKIIPRPLPCGNVHDNYIKAEHIFMKSRGLYGQHVEVLLIAPSGLRMFDLVAFSQSTPQGDLMEEISGYYFVSGKNSFVNANQYWEKLELTAGGLS